MTPAASTPRRWAARLLPLTLPLVVATLTLLGTAPERALYAQDTLDAAEIVERALDTQTLGFQSGEVTMVFLIQDGTEDARERRIHVRGHREGDLNRALVRVISPPALAGQAYLFLQNAAGEDDVYVYLPAIDDAPRRVAGSQKNASFMGTHFTYADLESRDLRDAVYTRHPDETVGEFPVYVIDAEPSATAESEHGRVRLWIRQSDMIPLRVRFYDRAGELSKTLFSEETAEQDGRVYVRRLTVRPESGGATTMVIESADFNASVSAAEFTPRSLVQ